MGVIIEIGAPQCQVRPPAKSTHSISISNYQLIPKHLIALDMVGQNHPRIEEKLTKATGIESLRLGAVYNPSDSIQ